MTIVVILEVGMTWGATEAKAKFSELLDQVREDGPQEIRRRKEVFYVLTGDQRARDLETARKGGTPRSKKSVGTLGDFFRNSPLADSGVRIERVKFKPRRVDL